MSVHPKSLFKLKAKLKRLTSIDQWLRSRIRMCTWKSWKKPKTMVKNLIRCGIKPYWARIYGNSSKGYWANAEPHVRWCERSENESRRKTTSFSSYFRFPRRSFLSVLSDPTVTSYHFVPRKRFKRYERVLETCFVRGKRFRWNESRLSDGAQAVGDAFQSFVQKFARTCQIDADEAFSRFAVH